MRTQLTLCLLLISTSLFSQDALTTGNRIFGGGLSFSHSDSENDGQYFSYDPLWPCPGCYYDRLDIKSSSFAISPYYGRFYDDFKMVGIRFGYSGSDWERERGDDFAVNRNESNVKSFTLGGFLRQYFPASDKFGMYFQSGVDFHRSIANNRNSYNFLEPGNGTDQEYEFEVRRLGGSLNGQLGIYFFILSQLSIETNLLQFAISYEDVKNTERSVDTIQLEEEGSNSRVDLNLINDFTFDKIFTINYYF